MSIKAWPVLFTKSIKQGQQAGIGGGMRHALGQTGFGDRADGADSAQTGRVVEPAGGVGTTRFAGDGAEMLRQAGLPFDLEQGAGLPGGTVLLRLTALYQPGMAPMLAGQQSDQQRGLAMGPRGQENCVVNP